MNPGVPLILALDAVYDAFAGYPRPLQMEAAPTRDPAKILATLSSAPLRDLTGEQIGPYAGWALSTVGSVRDYKHFLPRIIEQAILGPNWMGTRPPVTASRLNIAEWRAWPRPEHAAALEVFVAALRDSFHQHPDDGGDASEWLCALAVLGEDVRPLLREWASEPSGNALLQIANLATELSAFASLDAREQIFWADVRSETRAEIVSWLTSAQVGASLAAAHGIAENDTWRIDEAAEALAKFGASTKH